MRGKPLFTFAIIADTHINPVDGQSGSPWPSNALANERARWAMTALATDAPDFVLHLGDMVHPIPEQPDYAAAVERFRSITAKLQMPLHLLPGNHDLGDKPAEWMPAHPASAGSVSIYRDHFGPLWSAFDHRDCRFILHANPILGSGLADEEAQWQWLECELRVHRGQRIFFFTHYPLFLTDPDEAEHYDNLAPEPRERLRKLLLAHDVEAVFAAHVHTVFHTRLGEDAKAPFQHVVPTLSAMRLDYSHLFKAPPPLDEENGRNDKAKLGYYLVDIFETGYRLRLRRSHGEGLAEGEAMPEIPSLPNHDLANRRFGVDLRQGWADLRSIPYSGVVDEFGRKQARNDYLITALQEAAIRDLRVPIHDLRDGKTHRRMEDLAVFGHRFQLFTLNPPDPETANLLSQGSQFCSRLELIAREHDLEHLVQTWRQACPELRLIASPLWTSADAEKYGSGFSHAIGHGFRCDESCLASALTTGADGAMFRIRAGENIHRAAGILQAYSGQVVVYLDLAKSSPAEFADDDRETMQRVRQAVSALETLPPNAVLIFDTLEDLDRGYYPRHGLYDIRFNPRAAVRVLMSSDRG